MDSLYHEIFGYDPRVIAGLIAIAGTFIAAILSSAGYLYRVRTERKKSLRKVLYLLLEIRHTVITRLFDPNAATEEYLKEMSKRLADRGIKPDNDEIPRDYRDLIKNHFNNIFVSFQSDLDEKMLTPFEEALLEMSTITPALAFQLRGREKLDSLAGHTNQYTSQINEKFKSDMPDPILQKMLDLSNNMKADVLEDVYKCLNNDVMLLAKACGWRDFRACQKIIKNGPSPNNNLDMSELDTMIDFIIESIKTSAHSDGSKPSPES